MDYADTVKNLLAAATGRDDLRDMAPEEPLLGHVAELDSMAIVTFFTSLEEEFGIFIEDDEVSAELFETLGSLIDFARERVEA